jgi:hypothetical protein
LFWGTFNFYRGGGLSGVVNWGGGITGNFLGFYRIFLGGLVWTIFCRVFGEGGRHLGAL